MNAASDCCKVPRGGQVFTIQKTEIVAVSRSGVAGCYALVVRRMFGSSSVMISALETSRLRSDSEITTSGMGLYHSCGVNCEVTMVETLRSHPARILSSWCAVATSIGLRPKLNSYTTPRDLTNCIHTGSRDS